MTVMGMQTLHWGHVAAGFAVGALIAVALIDKPAPRFSCEGRIAESPYAELATPGEPDGEWLSDVIVFTCHPIKGE